ncbi:MAG: nitroreductase family deazaflavin-dependent oxidoreductase [Acidimicrobiia bacterium]|nr:nitroreductase family deazaflavin-dependent oxidoreductase [Acidimicrobiia bacterium]
MSDFNTQVIEDFRANGGAVDVAANGFFKGKPVLILHNTGAKTGKVRLNPLVYATHNGSYVVAASKGGAPSHPHWFLNVRANPDVTVEVGTEEFPARATILEDGPLRDELYAKMVAIMGQFAKYETMTERRIPVVILERAD